MISSHKQKDFSAANKHEAARKQNRKRFVLFRGASRLKSLYVFILLVCFIFTAAEISVAQTRKAKAKVAAKKSKAAPKQSVSNLPKVTQIDAEALKKLLKPNGRPLLVNFWATWCDPCREEFPDLVKIGADYKDKIDVITVSLDELSEINRDVPKFLADMRAETPAYLLKTPNEEAVIASVSKDWQGGLPFTIFYNAQGEAVCSKQGKFQTELLRAEIEKALGK